MQLSTLKECHLGSSKNGEWSLASFYTYLGASCEIFCGLWASRTCTNESTGEDLCAGHASGGEGDGLFGRLGI